MPGGRPPKPIEQKRLLGNPGKRALPEPLTILPASTLVPTAPRGLKKPGKDAWRRLWTAGRAWLSPDGDLGVLTRLAQAYDEREELRAIIDKDGRFATGSMGQLTSHPAVDQLRALEAQMTRWEALCGFTPSDRSKLGYAEVKRVSRLEEFLARRRGEA
jgi:P27 family predicted phage terminase small subunit